MTSIETGPTWSERLSPRNWTLAWKLVIVGLVPALLALALGVLRISDQAGAAADLGQGSRLVAVEAKVGSATDALRQERNEATLYVAGKRTGDRNALSTGFGQTDAVSTTSLDAVRSAGPLDPASSAALDQAATLLGGLTALRRDVTDSATVASSQVSLRYTEIVNQFNRLDGSLLGQVSTPATAALTSAVNSARDAKEQLALQHTVLGTAIRVSQLQVGDAQAVGANSSRLASDAADYKATLSPDQFARYGPLLDPAADAQRAALAAAVVTTPPEQPVAQSPAALDSAYTAELTTANRASGLIRQDIGAAGAAAEAQASNLAGINSVILMLGLLVGITIAVLVARSLIRSLRVLRTAALDVAERRLPQAVESMRAGEAPDVTVDPVPLNSRDEVGQVARAFDAVHGQAIRLAADQAALQSNVSAMFVNLSRRSQALVERQLQLIEQLESNEQDADQLSNLFQLDHLATRMRRNSENLLVLAGTDLAKRNIAPVPVVDVLRAAVSEVEQYQRIVVQAPPTAAIVGRAGSDLVHLLAELLDNATNFSPPDSQVVMSTTRTPDGSIVVEIADRGVGMIDHELSDANQRLGGPSSVDVSASRRMGLFVVGRLGARHGIGVRLTTSAAGGPGAGLTASVTVPAYLIPSTQPAEPGRPIGIPQPAGVPAQGGRAGDVPPQRANGAGRGGSISALIAGTDGPANPAGVLDGTDSPLFGTSPANSTNGASTNGSRNGNGALPSRRPGSSLRPEGPPPPEQSAAMSGPSDDDGSTDESEAQQLAAERRAREVSEQARRDQEAAERSAQARAAQREREAAQEAAETQAAEAQAAETQAAETQAMEAQATEAQSANRHEQETNGPVESTNGSHGNDTDSGHPNGVRLQAFLAPAPFGNRTGTDSSDDIGDAASTSVADGDERSDSSAERSDLGLDRPGSDGQRTDQQQRGGTRPEPANSAATAPPASRPTPVVSPPTTPMPVVRPSGASTPSSVTPAPQSTPEAPRPERQTGPRPAPAPQVSTPQPAAAASPAPQPLAPRPAVQSGPPQAPAAFPPGRPDELFAPSVPNIAEPGRAADEAQAGFERGETTPIFEEIASAWFRSNRPVPVTWETDDGESPSEAPAHPAPGQAPQGLSPQNRSPAPQQPVQPQPSRFDVRPPQAAEAKLPQRPAAPAPAPAPRPVALPTPASVEAAAPEPQPLSQPEPTPVAVSASDRAFAGAADEGWRAANGTETDRPDELTAAGLPKRRPRARLVPGSAGSAVLSPPLAASRSAETIRGRLASYQQGVRQGRETRGRGDVGTDTSTNPDTHDEEPS